MKLVTCRVKREEVQLWVLSHPKQLWCGSMVSKSVFPWRKLSVCFLEPFQSLPAQLPCVLQMQGRMLSFLLAAWAGPWAATHGQSRLGAPCSLIPWGWQWVWGHGGLWDTSDAGGSPPPGRDCSRRQLRAGKLAAGLAVLGRLCAFFFGGVPKNGVFCNPPSLSQNFSWQNLSKTSGNSALERRWG